MELRHLRYFVKTVETMNFTEAASLLFITQGSLSQQIKMLEDELGVQLFNRSGKKIFLSDAGEAFLPYARQSIRDAEDGRQRLLDMQGLKTGEINIGVSYSQMGLLTAVMGIFCKQHPGIKFNISYQHGKDLLEDVHRHCHDFVLCFKPLEMDDTLECETLFETRLAAIVAQGHPLAGLQSVSLEQLSHHPLAMPSTATYARLVIDHVCHTAGVRLNPAVELSGISMLHMLARSGGWATLLSATTLHYNNQGGLVAVPLQESPRLRASIISSKGSYQKRAVAEFLQALRSYAASERMGMA